MLCCATMADPDRAKLPASRGAIRFGGGALAVAALLMCSPLALGPNGFNKYLVAFGFVAACLGVACVLHALLDRLLLPRRRGE